MAKLIDTNVLVAASAHANPLSGIAERASPADFDLRKRVFDAVTEFERSSAHIVLDLEGLIWAEYDRNMGYQRAMRDQDYGILLLQQLQQTSRITYVTIEVDTSTGESIGRIDEELKAIVTDREDQKWIAAAVSHSVLYEKVFPPIVYAAESDWFLIEDQLTPRGFLFERLFPNEWYEGRHQR